MECLRQLVEREHRPGRSLLLARVHGQGVDQLRADGLLDWVDGVLLTVEAAVDQAAESPGQGEDASPHRPGSSAPGNL
jgi:hypothetical protein